MKKGYIVKITSFTTDHFDSYVDEYTGIIYKNRADALPELEEAIEYGHDAFIEAIMYNA